MKKIMFSDKYGLTKAVLEGRKTMTRRIVPSIPPVMKIASDGKMEFHPATQLEIRDGYLISHHDGCKGSYNPPAECQPKYKIGEVVAVAQAYKDAINPLDWVNTLIYKDEPGWTNKMYVRADLMPHRIRMNSLRVERLQDITDQDCLREGIYEVPFCEYSWEDNGARFGTPREAFAGLIKMMLGRKVWDDNPYVYVFDFELVK